MVYPYRLSESRLHLRLRTIRASFYAIISVVAGTTTVFGMGGAEGAALSVVIAVAVVGPMVVRPASRFMEAALWIDAVVALAVWWLYGPTVGVDFILFYVVAVSAFLLPRRSAVGTIIAAALSELAQAPLHVLAERVALPLFHRDPGFIGLAEFSLGVALRTSAILLMAGLFLTVSNILRRSEAARERSETRYRTLYERAPIAYLTVDSDGRITRANDAAVALLSRSKEDLLGSTCLDLYAEHPNGRQLAMATLSDATSGKPIRDVQLLLRSDIGDELWVSLSADPVLDASGNTVEIRAALVDISQLRRAERLQADAKEQLENLVAAKDRFIASVSHEIRTPLTGVLGFTETLRSDWQGYSDEQRRQFIGYIAEQSRDMSFLVEDLLVAARAELHELSVVCKPVDLGALVSSVIDLCSHCHPRFWDRVDVDVDGSTAIAMGDAPRIRQILRNLLTNALRYGGERIRFAVAADHETAVIEVRDSGAGLPDDFVESMFEPYAVANRSAGVTDSVGLGLAVAHSLARLMDGELRYFREDNETVFQLQLAAGTANQAVA